MLPELRRPRADDGAVHEGHRRPAGSSRSTRRSTTRRGSTARRSAARRRSAYPICDSRGGARLLREPGRHRVSHLDEPRRRADGIPTCSCSISIRPTDGFELVRVTARLLAEDARRARPARVREDDRQQGPARRRAARRQGHLRRSSSSSLRRSRAAVHAAPRAADDRVLQEGSQGPAVPRHDAERARRDVRHGVLAARQAGRCRSRRRSRGTRSTIRRCARISSHSAIFAHDSIGAAIRGRSCVRARPRRNPHSPRLGPACYAGQTMTVRPPAVAGSFYPGARDALDAQLSQLLGAVKTPEGPCPKALIVPHAGYVYSGADRGERVRARGAVRRSHRARRAHRAGAPRVRRRARVDRRATARARRSARSRSTRDRQACTREPGRARARALARGRAAVPAEGVSERARRSAVRLARDARGSRRAARAQLWGGPETLIVISSDLSHYLPYAEGRALDQADRASRSSRSMPPSRASTRAARSASTACCGSRERKRHARRARRSAQLRRHRRHARRGRRLRRVRVLRGGADERAGRCSSTWARARLREDARRRRARRAPATVVRRARRGTFVTLRWTRSATCRAASARSSADRAIVDDVAHNAVAAGTARSAREARSRSPISTSSTSRSRCSRRSSRSPARPTIRVGTDGIVHPARLDARDVPAGHVGAAADARAVHGRAQAQGRAAAKLPECRARSSAVHRRQIRDPATTMTAHAGGTRPTTVASSATCARATASCSDGQRGMCFVRQRVGDEMVLTTYGRSSGFAIDPIEKKPLNHFYPGTSVLSFGTAGCNLACKFCQNWDISKSQARWTASPTRRSPEGDRARRASAPARTRVAFTYNDPTIFAEYAMDVADACHALGIHTVAVTAGYIHAEPRRAFYDKIDAANVDLKAFTDDFYRPDLRRPPRAGEGHAALPRARDQGLDRDHDAHHPDAQRLRRGAHRARRVRRRRPRARRAAALQRVPSRLPDARPPADAARDAPRARAGSRRAAGLRYVYTGNVHDREGDTTLLPVAAARR